MLWLNMKISICHDANEHVFLTERSKILGPSRVRSKVKSRKKFVAKKFVVIKVTTLIIQQNNVRIITNVLIGTVHNNLKKIKIMTCLVEKVVVQYPIKINKKYCIRWPVPQKLKDFSSDLPSLRA